MGMPIPDSLIIEKSNLHCRQELNEILDAQAKQEKEMVEQQQQMQMQQMAVMTDGIEAKAKSDQALAMERLNKINLDEALSAERIQRAEEDKTAAELNYIKSLKELEGMDLASMTQKIAMLKSLSEIEHADAANRRAELEAEAGQNLAEGMQEAGNQQMMT